MSDARLLGNAVLRAPRMLCAEGWLNSRVASARPPPRLPVPTACLLSSLPPGTDYDHVESLIGLKSASLDGYDPEDSFILNTVR